MKITIVGTGYVGFTTDCIEFAREQNSYPTKNNLRRKRQYISCVIHH